MSVGSVSLLRLLMTAPSRRVVSNAARPAHFTGGLAVSARAPIGLVMAPRNLDFELTAGRRSIVFPAMGDPVRLLTALTRTGTRYLVVYDTPIELAYYFPIERDRWPHPGRDERSLPATRPRPGCLDV